MISFNSIRRRSHLCYSRKTLSYSDKKCAQQMILFMQIYARLSLKCNIISEYLVTHCIVSRKFQELISEINLRVAYDKITTRNLSNFLKICQNQQADVQDSEMKEIYLIAKLFQADQIYKTGLTFVQNNIDSNFLFQTINLKN